MNGLSKKSNIQIPASDHAKLLKDSKRDFYSLPKTVYVQGVSYWNGQTKWLWGVESRSSRKIDIFVEWCLVSSGGLEIWVSSTSFQESNISWPQQPPTERISVISEK